MTRGLQLDYKEVDVRDGNSPVESFDLNSASATRVLEVAWADRAAAVYQLLGYAQFDASTPSYPRISRYLPDFHPDYPFLVATKIPSVKGVALRGYDVNNGRKIARYERAWLTVQYEFPPYDLLEDDQITSEFDRYRTFEARPAAEYLSPPTGAFLTWSEGDNEGEAFPGNVGFVLGTIDFHWRWLQVPFEALPFDAIQGTIGRVNKTAFADCDPGTLLLIGVDYKRCNSPYGLRTWDIEYTARYNPRLHNVFYDFQAKGWFQASTDGDYHMPGSVDDGKLLYDEREYLDLFTPPALTP